MIINNELNSFGKELLKTSPSKEILDKRLKALYNAGAEIEVI